VTHVNSGMTVKRDTHVNCGTQIKHGKRDTRTKIGTHVKTTMCDNGCNLHTLEVSIVS